MNTLEKTRDLVRLRNKVSIQTDEVRQDPDYCRYWLALYGTKEEFKAHQEYIENIKPRLTDLLNKRHLLTSMLEIVAERL